ncbi:hypothetical protein HYALB_00002607 [Hymenoscyphus albidus]|uniref:NEDD8-activating enzyme E1 regulatory subunit n=1 Tax=Hymenoscyphus albidus TaxID=595503 RepID=A0A9N9LR78_9HELO|nr:hypothetical protein HYALB_00002607 [Hymenoscyphus albidus]
MTEVIRTQTPPILHGPSDKEKKYDRQLRLWAASGQQALEEAHILLVNSGIGKFTIADKAIVEEADLGVNFFLDEESLGKPRSEACVKLLQELNPDVKGDWYQLEKDQPLQTLLDQQKFTLLMYSLPIEPETLLTIQNYANENKLPLFSIHSAGFYSAFRIHLPGSFPIVDTHPESTTTPDLRLRTPWKGLSDFAAEITADIDIQEAREHGHIPYVALILHYLIEWKEKHGSIPSEYAEKKEFAKFLAAKARTNNPEGGEENFDEGVASVLKLLHEPKLEGSVKEIFDHEPNGLEAKSSFWIIAGAVKKFYEKHKALPLPGSVPDMKAQSNVYVKLQNIYKAKAREDVAEVLESVRAHPLGKDIPTTEVEVFCKNAAFIKLVNGAGSKTSDVVNIANEEFKSDQMAANNPEFGMRFSLLPIYLALNATCYFASATSSEILATINKIVPEASSNPRLVQAAEEVARAKGGELHNISSLTGGMVAQEIIKIITKQYIPIDNTCIYDGITSRTQIFKI